MTYHLSHIMAIACGGTLGATLRFLLTSQIGLYGVLIANILGCLLIGAVISYIAIKSSISHTTTLFITSGLLGGFTTFSAFSLETIQMIDTHKYLQATLYVTVSIGGGLLAFILGRVLVKQLL